MDDRKKLKEQKVQEKLNKIKEKQRLKEAKLASKKQSKLDTDDFLNDINKSGDTKKEELKKIKKQKFKKEKIDYRLAFKEAPIKFLKEINKIKWSSRKNLGIKFLWVIIFILIFGTFFFFADWGFQSLFRLIKII